jgi:tetratricopeptide (TPR) repeat protein
MFGTKKLSGELLLAAGGSIMFLVFGIFLASPHTIEPPQPAASAELAGMTDFELGQYYFNHDDDPAGPYDIAKAQYYYEKEIAQNPKGNKLVWYQSGRIDFINGDFDRALEKFATQIEYFGDSVHNVYYMIGLTYGYKARVSGLPEDWKAGEDAFLKFIDFSPQAPWSRVDLAWIYFSQGKYEQMLPVLQEGLQYRPDNPWLLNMYGLALFNTGNTEMAREQFYKAKEQAALLTTDDWGRAYPGNNPEAWGRGLSEFRSIIEKNIELTLAGE